MVKYLPHMVLIALVGLIATDSPAAPTAWSSGMTRDIAAAPGQITDDTPLILVRRGGSGGRGGGGGNWTGAGGGHFNRSYRGRAYYGSGWGGVAAGAALGAAGTAYYYPSSEACPYPEFPNCGFPY